MVIRNSFTLFLLCSLVTCQTTAADQKEVVKSERRSRFTTSEKIGIGFFAVVGFASLVYAIRCNNICGMNYAEKQNIQTSAEQRILEFFHAISGERDNLLRTVDKLEKELASKTLSNLLLASAKGCLDSIKIFFSSKYTPTDLDLIRCFGA